MPPLSPSFRWRSTSAARTFGKPGRRSCGAIDFRRADGRRDIVTVDDDGRTDIERGARCESGHGVFILERQLIVECLPGDGAIHRPGVEMVVAEAPRDLARHCAFAGSGRTVNGDNQATGGHVREYIRAVM